MKRLFILLLTILALSNSVFAIPVKGQIKQRGALATKALIIFSSDGVEKARAITGDDGLYYIPDVPEGRYSVKISYRDITREYPGFVVPSAKYDFEI